MKELQMKKLLAVAALGEVATGVVLAIYPPIVIKLLFEAEISGASLVLSRITGIALIGLGVACWPCEKASCALCGMLTYSSLVMLYLAYVGASGGPVGVLLWPAVIVHAILTLFLAREWLRQKESKAADETNGRRSTRDS
jgi:hypothetical protein